MFPGAELLQNYGPVVLLIGFFVYRDWRREENLSKRIEHLEKYRTEKLEKLQQDTAQMLKTATDAITTATSAIASTSRALEQFTKWDR